MKSHSYNIADGREGSKYRDVFKSREELEKVALYSPLADADHTSFILLLVQNDLILDISGKELI